MNARTAPSSNRTVALWFSCTFSALSTYRKPLQNRLSTSCNSTMTHPNSNAYTWPNYYFKEVQCSGNSLISTTEVMEIFQRTKTSLIVLYPLLFLTSQRHGWQWAQTVLKARGKRYAAHMNNWCDPWHCCDIHLLFLVLR